ATTNSLTLDFDVQAPLNSDVDLNGITVSVSARDTESGATATGGSSNDIAVDAVVDGTELFLNNAFIDSNNNTIEIDVNSAGNGLGLSLDLDDQTSQAGASPDLDAAFTQGQADNDGTERVNQIVITLVLVAGASAGTGDPALGFTLPAGAPAPVQDNPAPDTFVWTFDTSGLTFAETDALLKSIDITPNDDFAGAINVEVKTTTVDVATVAGPNGTSGLEATEDDNTDVDTYNFTVDVVNPPRAFVIGSNQFDDSDPQTTTTDNHTLDTRVDDVEQPGLSLGNAGPGPIVGEIGDDLLVGDPGGATPAGIPPGNFNIALILDVSGSMGPDFGGFAGNGQTRLQLLQDAINNLLNEFSDHQGVINLKIIPFSTTAQTSFEFPDFSDILPGGSTAQANFDFAVNFVDGFNAQGTTNYESPLISATDFLAAQVTATSGFSNILFFLTDGGPNTIGDGDVIGNENAQQALNAALENPLVTDAMNGTGIFAGDNAVEVRGIGIGDGVRKDIIDQVDNSPPSGNTNPDTGTVIGDAQIVFTPEELQGALFEGFPDQVELAPVGGDLIQGRLGNDLIFGDVPNTDQLAIDQGLDLDLLPAGSGWEVFDELVTNHGWTIDVGGTFDPANPDVRAFLEDPNNWAQLTGDTRGEGDTIDAGGGDDTVFGQGGNDTIDAGEGNDFVNAGDGDDSLFGGTGDDTLISDDAALGTVVVPPDFSEKLIALGPVAYYRLGESSGTVANDQIGGNNGQYLNGVTLGAAGVVVDDPDTAAQFDGADDRVQINNSATFSLDSGTVQFWFNASAITGDNVLFSKINNGLSNADEFIIRLDEVGSTNTANLELDFFGTGDDLASITVADGGNGPVSLNTWNHVAFTWDNFNNNGDGIVLYLNGARVGFDKTSFFSLVGSSEDFFIGGQENGTDDFAGLIDEVAIFDRALTFQEINQIIDDTEAGLSRPPATSEFRGDDLIEGGEGADTLIGGLGDDILDGGIDIDIDTFVINLQGDDGLGNGDGQDTLRNFDGARDILRFENVIDADNSGGAADLSDLNAAITSIQDGASDLVISFNNGSSLTLEGFGQGTGNRANIEDVINATQIDIS
ncbi:MAG: VWA domain-containing protein, partial [Kiloniellales bacterium]|nr:VWA domain-containing protein [Kiloniellales bacterium]